MAMFQDNAGRDWVVLVNIASIERARSATGVNVCDLVKPEVFDNLDVDVFTTCRILAAICHNEIESRNMSPEDFYEAIRGEPIDNGRGALLDALADFIPPRHRDQLAMLREMQAMFRDEAMSNREVVRLNHQLKMKQIEADFLTAKQSLTNAMNLPESSGSTRDD